jgi:hypothetical protein
MDSDNVPHDQSCRPSVGNFDSVYADHVDQLVMIARDLAGIVLILDAGGHK